MKKALAFETPVKDEVFENLVITKLVKQVV